MSTVELLSEAATARYAGVALSTLRRARQSGKVSPVQEIMTSIGTVRLYDGEAIKAFFKQDSQYQAHLERSMKGDVKRKVFS